MTRDTRDGAPKHRGWWKGDQGEVGAFLHGYDSLWLPASLLQANRRKQLVDALFALFIVHHGVGSEDWSADGLALLA